MIVNIEKEYSEFIAGLWQEFSSHEQNLESTTPKPNDNYNNISDSSNDFLAEKLNSIETKIPDQN
ncbi:MAG: hypothetical protein ACYTBP_04280 [Planctomycetota bacterium]|jgi:hypothetical protein